MFLREVNISIGTQIRSGSTMINTHWHAKIDVQQLFNFMILPVGRILIDLAVSITGTLQRCPQIFIFVKYEECSLAKNYESTRRTEPRGEAHWLKYQSVHSCYSFTEKWSRKKNKWELSALVSSHSLDEETPVESQSDGPYLTSEVHIAILFFVLKAASEEHNVIRVLCGDIDCRLPARVLRVQN